MDLVLVITMLIIGGMFAAVAFFAIGGLYLLITIILHKIEQKPAFKERVRIAMTSCPDYLYGFKFLLTGHARQSKVTVGHIVGFSRMRNEHLGNLVESISNKKLKKKEIDIALKKGITELEKLLVGRDKDGVNLPPKQFWLDLEHYNYELLNDLVFLNFVVVIPKIFGFLCWIPPIVRFLPKNVIIFLDSQLSTPNKELFGDIWAKGCNLNMTNGDYWFVDDERLTKYTISMCIRSDAYVYELVESWHKLSEISKEITKTQSGVISELLKFKTPVGASAYGPPRRVDNNP